MNDFSNSLRIYYRFRLVAEAASPASLARPGSPRPKPIQPASQPPQPNLPEEVGKFCLQPALAKTPPSSIQPDFGARSSLREWPLNGRARRCVGWRQPAGLKSPLSSRQPGFQVVSSRAQLSQNCRPRLSICLGIVWTCLRRARTCLRRAQTCLKDSRTCLRRARTCLTLRSGFS